MKLGGPSELLSVFPFEGPSRPVARSSSPMGAARRGSSTLQRRSRRRVSSYRVLDPVLASAFARLHGVPHPPCTASTSLALDASSDASPRLLFASRRGAPSLGFGPTSRPEPVVSSRERPELALPSSPFRTTSTVCSTSGLAGIAAPRCHVLGLLLRVFPPRSTRELSLAAPVVPFLRLHGLAPRVGSSPGAAVTRRPTRTPLELPPSGFARVKVCGLPARSRDRRGHAERSTRTAERSPAIAIRVPCDPARVPSFMHAVFAPMRRVRRNRFAIRGRLPEHGRGCTLFSLVTAVHFLPQAPNARDHLREGGFAASA